MAEGRNQKTGDGDGKDVKASGQPDPKPTTETNREDGRYENEYLVRNAVSLLDSRPAIVAGALARSDRQTHTLEQAEKLLADHAEQAFDPDEGVAV